MDVQQGLQGSLWTPYASSSLGLSNDAPTPSVRMLATTPRLTSVPTWYPA